MTIIKTKGLIMKEYTVRESDKFIAIFTKSNGKLMVNAPRAKMHNRGFASGTEAFVYGQFVLQKKRGSYQLLQVDIIEAFHDLRNDLFKLAYAAYVLELTDVSMEENLASADVLRLLVRTLQAMCKGQINASLVRHIFELKHMCLLGFMPNVFSCNGCGLSCEECGQVYFDIAQGGLVCPACSAPSPYRYPISAGSLHTMQYIVSSAIDDLYTFTVSDDILFEFKKIMSKYISYYIDKQLKTLDFIKDMETM